MSEKITDRERKILGLASCMLNASNGTNDEVMRMIDALDKYALSNTHEVWESVHKNKKIGTIDGLIAELKALIHQEK